MEHNTLYKRTSTGAIQIWWIEQEDDAYRVWTGQIDGKKTNSEWKHALPKNVGKKNETTGIEQAAFEIQAEYTKKLNQGRYSETLDDVDEEKFFAPMLAYPYEKYPVTQEQFDAEIVFAQPKLDGIRCIATRTGLWTRKGKPIVAVPHVWEAVTPIFEATPDVVLDGELYNHEYRDHLNRISGLVRKTKLTDTEFDETKMIQYHMYDCMTGTADPFEDRFTALLNLPEIRGKVPVMGDGVLQLVDTHIVPDLKYLDDLNMEWLEYGYEGQIIRISDTEYENKRTKKLLKRKEFIDEEFTIVGFTEGMGNRSGMAGNIVYRMDDGKEFSSGIAGGVDFYKHLWENQDTYIGGQGTVRYFKLTEYGIPYLPVTHVVYKGSRDV